MCLLFGNSPLLVFFFFSNFFVFSPVIFPASSIWSLVMLSWKKSLMKIWIQSARYYVHPIVIHHYHLPLPLHHLLLPLINHYHLIILLIRHLYAILIIIIRIIMILSIRIVNSNKIITNRIRIIKIISDQFQLLLLPHLHHHLSL